jgi:hypothetical protein
MLSWQTELEESVEPLAVCKIEDSNDRLLQFVQVVDAYALIGDISGLAEKLQSFYMQEVLSETHSVLKNTVQEVVQLITPSVPKKLSAFLFLFVPK